MTDLRVGHFFYYKKRSDSVVQKKLPTINSAHGSETRNIINELIKIFNNMGYTYDEALQKAHDVLSEAEQTNEMNEDVQQQIDDLILSKGESDAEVINARGNHSNLRTRLENTDLRIEKLENYPPDVADQLAFDTFVLNMNNIAKRIGMKDSLFKLPSGHHAIDQRSSARDLVRLGAIASEYDELVKAWSKNTYTFRIQGKNARNITLQSTVTNATLNNSHKIVGGKTGTAEYINSLISVVEGESGEWIVGVVQGNGLDRFTASVELYNIAKRKIREKKERSLVPKNLVYNGDFYHDLDGWRASSGGPEVVTSKYNSSPKSLNVSSAGTAAQLTKGVPLINGNKYYASIHSNVTSITTGAVGLQIYQVGSNFSLLNYSSTSNWQRKSGIFTSNMNNASTPIYVGGTSSPTTSAHVDDVVIVDLTSFFGKGNEPTAEEFEAMDFDFTSQVVSDDDVTATNASVIVKPLNALAYEDKDFEYLYEKNAEVKTIPGSTTKVMTALTMLENIDDINELMEIKEYDVMFDGIELFEGDVMTYKDALHCMMLPSSNIAAHAVARNVGKKIFNTKNNVLRKH